jgi:mono/diheme cytochrome c family protein
MTRTAVAVVFCALVLPATAWTQDAQVKRGQELYAEKKCSLCHSIAGKGNPKGSLDGAGAKWKAEELHDWIVNWKAMAAKHNATRKPPMMDFSKLPKADVDALVAYLATLKQ